MSAEAPTSRSPAPVWQTVALVAVAGSAGAWLAHQWLQLRLPWSGWTHLAGAVVVAPWLEEWIFRPLLQQGLAGWLHEQRPGRAPDGGSGVMPFVANVLTACVFVLVHSPGRGLSALAWLVPSLVLGEVWRRHRRLAPCALLHGWFNASLMLVSL